jgi:hypothetical protein
MENNLLASDTLLSTHWTSHRIQDTLAIYRPEFICVISASSSRNFTVAQVNVPLYPFTKPGHIDYITASMASLIVAQMGYLHIRHLISDSANPMLYDITDNDFLASRDAGNIVFRKESLKYQRKAEVHEAHRCVISSTHLHRSRTSRIGAYTIDIAQGAITGEGIIAMLLPEKKHGDR